MLPKLAEGKEPGLLSRLFGATTSDHGFIRESIDAFLVGYEMSLTRLDEYLAARGLEPIRSLGERFDPETMQAVGVEVRDDLPADAVIEEVQRGYRHEGKIVRFARVKVARRSAGISDAGVSEGDTDE